MSTAVLMELMLEQVSPELRPAFATPIPIKGAIGVLAGGAGSGTFGVELAAPSSRMLPEVSTAPLTICAIAASTVPVLGAVLVPPSGSCTNSVKLATGVAGVQLVSTSPGWATGSPAFP